jgi:hypothetical protein
MPCATIGSARRARDALDGSIDEAVVENISGKEFAVA